jgi:hypothetical protein
VVFFYAARCLNALVELCVHALGAPLNLLLVCLTAPCKARSHNSEHAHVSYSSMMGSGCCAAAWSPSIFFWCVRSVKAKV